MKELELLLLYIIRILRRQKFKIAALTFQIAMGILMIVLAISFFSHYQDCKEYFQRKYSENMYNFQKYNIDLEDVMFSRQEINKIRTLPYIKEVLINYDVDKEQEILEQLVLQKSVMGEFIDRINIVLCDNNYNKFFSTELLYGRDFDENDTLAVVISKEAAYVLFGKENAVGEKISLGELGEYSVIGIVENFYRSFNFSVNPIDIYFPYYSFENNAQVESILVKGIGKTTEFEQIGEIENIITDGQLDIRVSSERLLDDFSNILNEFKQITFVTMGFGVVLLFIALLGNLGISLAFFYKRLKVYSIEILLSGSKRNITKQILIENAMNYILGSVLAVGLSIPLKKYLSSINSFYAGVHLGNEVIIYVILVILFFIIMSSINIIYKIGRLNISQSLRL